MKAAVKSSQIRSSQANISGHYKYQHTNVFNIQKFYAVPSCYIHLLI